MLFKYILMNFSDTEDGCEFSKSLSNCLDLEIE